MAGRGASGLFLRDIAGALMRQGLRPAVYLPKWGPVAEHLQAMTVAAFDDLRHPGETPDIHAQQHAATEPPRRAAVI